MGVASQVFFFGGAMSHFDWPITSTNLKLWWLPKIKVSIGKWSAYPVGWAIKLRRGELWAKHME